MESNIYNKFSEEYDQLFYNQIIDFKTKLFQKYETQFVDFYPSFGIKPGQRCDFIIYGQALNGWGASFNVNENDLDIKTRVAESIEYSNSYYAKKNHCPLDWVNVYWSPKNYSEYASNAEEKAFYDEKITYRAFRSFFWNVTYKLLSSCYNLDINSFDWAKRMVWSNLYKIAPLRGNPNQSTKDIQQQYAIELVRKEIEEVSPKYCVVLTNEAWWAPFRNGLQTEILHHDSGHEVISLEQYHDTKIILTTRPYRGNSNTHVAKILSLISLKFL